MYLFIIILSIFLAIMPLPAKALEAMGIGEDYETAKEDAILNLAVQVSGESIISETHTALTLENGDETGNYYNNTSSHYTISNLLGVQYKIISKDDSTMHVMAYIDESSADKYLNALNGICRNIDSIRIKKTQSYEVQQLSYTNLLNLLWEYETYVHIVRLLGVDDSIIPRPKSDMTYISMQIEYSGFLLEYEENMDSQLRNIKNKNTDEYYRLKNQISDIQTQQHNLMKESADERLEIARRRNSRIENTISDMVHTSIGSIPSDSNGWQLVKDIENNLDYVKELVSKRNEMIDLELYNLTLSYNQEIAALRNIPYRKGELINGNPTPLAKNLRLQQEANLTEQYKRIKDDTRILIETQMGEQIDIVLDVLQSKIKDFNESEIRLSLSENPEYICIAEYDTEQGGWPFEICRNNGKTELWWEYFVPYRKMTGLEPFDVYEHSIDADFDKEAYYEFIDTIDIYDKLIFNGSYNIMAILDIHLDTKKNALSYEYKEVILEISNKQIYLKKLESDTTVTSTDTTVTSTASTTSTTIAKNSNPTVSSPTLVHFYTTIDAGGDIRVSSISSLDVGSIVEPMLSATIGVGLAFPINSGLIRTAANIKLSSVFYQDASPGFDINLNMEAGMTFNSIEDLYVFIRFSSIIPVFTLDLGCTYDISSTKFMDVYVGSILSLGFGSDITAFSAGAYIGVRT